MMPSSRRRRAPLSLHASIGDAQLPPLLPLQAVWRQTDIVVPVSARVHDPSVSMPNADDATLFFLKLCYMYEAQLHRGAYYEYKSGDIAVSCGALAR